MNKILVFGGSGMVGSALKEKACLDKFVFLNSKDADLTCEKQTKHIIQKYKPEGIINLAADCGGLYKNLEQGINLFDKNVKINSNVLKYSHEFDVKKVISCLSVCIFPELTTCPWITLPMSEKDVHSGSPHESNNCYAYAKRMSDILTKKYRDVYNRDYITVTPTNIFGPHDNFSENTGHVIPGLIKKAIESKETGVPFVVRGTGKALRQFIYSKDLANLLLWAYNEYSESETIIFSPDECSEFSIKLISETIAEIVGIDDIKYDSSFSDGQYKRTVSNKKLMNLNPSFKFTDIKKSLQETVEWYKINRNNLKK